MFRWVGSSPYRSSEADLLAQSLCHFLHRELSEYHRLLAVLEAQIAQNADVGDRPTAESSTGGGVTDGSVEKGLTLLRLGIWTAEMRSKLRMMSELVDDAKGERAVPVAAAGWPGVDAE